MILRKLIDNFKHKIISKKMKDSAKTKRKNK